MARPSYFYRNARAGDLLELFLVGAISTVLIVRFILHLIGYPSLGGHSLHIAHLLYGGLLMMVALVLEMSFLGVRVQRVAALVGGIGFGLFIDELGKFITRDNNYFFQPTIGLIYLVFVGLFVLFRALGRVTRLSPAEQMLNALALTEEVVINDLDESERQRALDYLRRADIHVPLATALRQALAKAPVAPPTAGWLERWRLVLERGYERVVATRLGVTTIDAVFVIKAAVGLVAAVGAVSQVAHHQFASSLVGITALQLMSSLVAVALIIAGVVEIHRSRLLAYAYFSRSLLVGIFLTQFFAFYRTQFAALPAFLINVLLYFTVRALIHQERRLQLRHHGGAAAR